MEIRIKCYIRIEIAPSFSVSIASLLIKQLILSFSSVLESLQYNCNEQLQVYQINQDDVREKVENCECKVATSHGFN